MINPDDSTTTENRSNLVFVPTNHQRNTFLSIAAQPHTSAEYGGQLKIAERRFLDLLGLGSFFYVDEIKLGLVVSLPLSKNPTKPEEYDDFELFSFEPGNRRYDARDVLFILLGTTRENLVSYLQWGLRHKSALCMETLLDDILYEHIFVPEDQSELREKIQTLRKTATDLQSIVESAFLLSEDKTPAIDGAYWEQKLANSMNPFKGEYALVFQEFQTYARDISMYKQYITLLYANPNQNPPLYYRTALLYAKIAKINLNLYEYTELGESVLFDNTEFQEKGVNISIFIDKKTGRPTFYCRRLSAIEKQYERHGEARPVLYTNDPNVIFSQVNIYGDNLLHRAVRGVAFSSIVPRLLNYPYFLTNINMLNAFGKTALHRFVKYLGEPEYQKAIQQAMEVSIDAAVAHIFRLFLNNGANISICSKDDQSTVEKRVKDYGPSIEKLGISLETLKILNPQYISQTGANPASGRSNVPTQSMTSQVNQQKSAVTPPAPQRPAKKPRTNTPLDIIQLLGSTPSPATTATPLPLTPLPSSSPMTPPPFPLTPLPPSPSITPIPPASPVIMPFTMPASPVTTPQSHATNPMSFHTTPTTSGSSSSGTKKVKTVPSRSRKPPTSNPSQKK